MECGLRPLSRPLHLMLCLIGCETAALEMQDITALTVGQN